MAQNTLTSQTAPKVSAPQQDTTLKQGKLGTLGVAFMIIAASAPLTVLAGGTPTNYAVSGLLGVPLSFLTFGVIVGLFAVGYGRMSAHVRNSGAFYEYVSQGLGLRQGIAAAILALVSYNLMQIGLFGIFGFSASAALFAITGISVPWWVTGGAAWLLIGVLGVSNIDLSAKLLGVLVTLEFIVVLAVSIFGFSSAPEGISTQPLSPSEFFAPGIGVLLVFTMAAFMGFESGAIYSEECRDPERTISRATYIAVFTVALFYAGSAWAMAVGIGPSNVIEQARMYGPDLVFVWIGQYSPVLANIMHVLFATSILAALLAFHNAAARYFFSLGRSGVLSEKFATTSKSGAPVVGSLTQSLLSLLVVAGFAIAGKGSDLGELYPVLTLFTWLTNAAGFGIVFLMAVTSIAIMRWAVKNHPEFPIFVKVIAPTLAAIGLAIVTILILANFDIMIGDTGPAALVWVMPGVVLGSGVLGLLWGEYLIRKDRVRE
ncbi:MAG TPA: APC family permease [Actinomyces sp.]|nr:APC family permease [Acidobacteriota bacterium]HHT41031.1 APC family permease [Actinomyces sp.]